MLKLYNTLAREKQTFVSLQPGHAKMYVCGMTVYDYCHLGHARVMVVFDLVARWLRASGYQLTYVRNITDIDDKIIRRAQENNETIHQLTDRFIAAMHEDATALGVLPPDAEPRATDYVVQMKDMIATLEKHGYAYVAANRDVCYSVRKFDGYGKLSGKSLEDLRAGERVDVTAGKQDPLDFVLWKQAKEEEPVEAKWESPWGTGRPGWHIECSAMASELLGAHFDIHGGGQDLQFPHHENEIAQSEGVCADPSDHTDQAHRHYVNYWMHNGFVRVDDAKMSKSLGNFFTIREVLKKYDAEVVRFFILRAHYRSPLNYSDQHLDDARQGLMRLYTALKAHDVAATPIDWNEPRAARFRECMEDDFNTAEAVAVLFDLASEVNKTGSPALSQLLRALGGILGLLQSVPGDFLQGRLQASGQAALDASTVDDAGIESLIAQRQAAKAAKDFGQADRIRAELAARGVLLKDSAGGTKWERSV